MNTNAVVAKATGQQGRFQQETIRTAEAAMYTLSRLHRQVMDTIYPDKGEPREPEVAARHLGLNAETVKAMHNSAIKLVTLTLMT